MLKKVMEVELFCCSWQFTAEVATAPLVSER